MHCAKPMDAKSGRQKFCGGACRKAHHMAQFAAVELDYEGEIVVNELEESPRRLAVAKLFDRFDSGGGVFDHFEPPRWINSADKRAGR
jgi:hypothetical protein